MAYTLLLVDDEKDFISELHEILEDEYDVIDAGTGKEAIEIIKKPNMIDLVLLDIRMPGLSGLEVLTRMKEIDPAVFIVILTGHGSKEVMIESLRGHADDFVEKPLNIDHVLSTIKRLLEKKQERVNGMIEKIKYFLDKNYHKNISLQTASDSLHLSPKYLSRIFKENTGVGFNDYKLKLKMDKAKELLSSTDLTVNEISYKIGYENTESFIRIFKKLNRCTPSHYRETGKRE
jgi:two-component system response regulator YesN